MIWVVSLIIALVAYFIFQGLHARHITRCHTDSRTTEHVPDSAGVSREQLEFHKQTAATNARLQGQSATSANVSANASASNGPSLLYADRTNAAREQQRGDNQYASQNQQQYSETTAQPSSVGTGNTRCTAKDNIDLDLELNVNADRTQEVMEYTAEHAPLSGSDVGVPANNSEYAVADEPQNSSNTGIGLAAGAAIAGAATVVSGRADGTDVHVENENYATQNAVEKPTGAGTTENIDLELGDSDNTHNDAEDIDGNSHDELLDFGDLTSDISDMLKELNLRETDSPRLEINKEEFEQLKTGDPGEVKPAKIENVADKLKNMLQ